LAGLAVDLDAVDAIGADHADAAAKCGKVAHRLLRGSLRIG
jgi:hypothetical protein